MLSTKVVPTPTTDKELIPTDVTPVPTCVSKM
jgi:hypothetical protein